MNRRSATKIFAQNRKSAKKSKRLHLDYASLNINHSWQKYLTAIDNLYMNHYYVFIAVFIVFYGK